jgi:hypothetical protein
MRMISRSTRTESSSFAMERSLPTKLSSRSRRQFGSFLRLAILYSEQTGPRAVWAHVLLLRYMATWKGAECRSKLV